MAIATLHLVYNNYEVFRRKEVKIRKGMAVQVHFLPFFALINRDFSL